MAATESPEPAVPREPQERGTRDKERTRQAIIDAATAMITEHGAGVSLADIAQHAGVSKGALTHHFANRGELEDALLADSAERLWVEVHAHVDIAEGRPGMLLRGYIRAMTSEDVLMRELFSPSSLLIRLGLDHSNGRVFTHDAARWRAAFAEDGLDLATSLAVRLAAEGVAASIDTPYLTPAEKQAVRERLLRMTEADPVAPAVI